MIEELKPYEALRSSGDPWLGEIPKHWSQKRLWSMSSPRVERNPGNLPLLSVFLDRGVIPYGEGGGQVHAPSLDLSNYQVVHPGDFVLNNQQAWRGSVGVSRHHGIISPAYIVLRLNGELLPAYANYLFRCPRLVDQFVAASKGVGDIQRQVFWPFLRRVTVPIPSTTEQEAIVRFLDHANRRIDQFIRAKKKLIALLNEQKLVIVQRRVLGGLRTQAVVRPSGISGVGEIPADWDVIPTRYLFRPVTRRDITGTEPKMSMSRHLGLVRSEVLHANRAAQAATAVAFSVCHPGDLVMNKYQAHAGLFGAATERGLITANYSVFAPTERAFTPYFALLYTSTAYRTIFRIASRGVGDGMMPLYTSAFHRVPSVVPPLGEQREIVTTVERETAGISAAIAIIERQLQQIGEYRTRLVATVVTGQLDVRSAAAGLPVVEPEAAPTEIEGDETDIEDGEAA